MDVLNQKREEFANDEASLKDINAEYDKILAKVQKRYNWLEGVGVAISDEMLKALRELGVVIVTNSDD